MVRTAKPIDQWIIRTHTEKLGFAEACAILQEVTSQTFWKMFRSDIFMRHMVA